MCIRQTQMFAFFNSCFGYVLANNNNNWFLVHMLVRIWACAVEPCVWASNAWTSTLKGVVWLWLLNDHPWGRVHGCAPMNESCTVDPVMKAVHLFCWQRTSNNDRTACRGWKWGPIGFHMTSKWATWGAVKVSVRPRTWHDVAKVVPRSICVVPIKHFGVLLVHILEDFGD